MLKGTNRFESPAGISAGKGPPLDHGDELLDLTIQSNYTFASEEVDALHTADDLVADHDDSIRRDIRLGIIAIRIACQRGICLCRRAGEANERKNIHDTGFVDRHVLWAHIYWELHFRRADARESGLLRQRAEDCDRSESDGDDIGPSCGARVLDSSQKGKSGSGRVESSTWLAGGTIPPTDLLDDSGASAPVSTGTTCFVRFVGGHAARKMGSDEGRLSVFWNGRGKVGLEKLVGK
ncbi:uncharacterized protein MYCGRDRAFT_92154 [Zymoseptoria tritici IPO323]|uniref:Uncharacterized protein n=1 Tax=Zymoseptoria tritici (strain CBS 115943 / IPO323) TaxID=336722 RepID=F9X7E7_ZYMTI|nr:uncharacterized protein MYCGRDRAFT_92154 [Zymoseptoria tritici IPO323]EGP89085.1 hypothetical protein MYCGRDRAFT_92154 [Zymoseptoria tritici IPO323]